MLWVVPQEAVRTGLPCVLEVGLSLAPSGLYFALGLAREGPVWLPQCHWNIVDDKDFPVDRELAKYLSGVPDFGEAIALLSRVRSDWRDAREKIGLESLPNF